MIRLYDLIKENSEKPKKSTGSYQTGDTYVSEEECNRFYGYMNYDFDINEFCIGMNVELEHVDVTGGSLVQTAMITAAHLREVPNYYTLLKKYVEKH